LYVSPCINPPSPCVDLRVYLKIGIKEGKSRE
jgi:hypothetical protein